MVEVTVAKLGVDSSTNSYVVILQERDGNRILPIWIGQPEAESIVMHMNSIKRERPLTHDLCKSLIVGLGGSLRRVQITKVQKNTYFAELHVQRNEEIDARPSDSIAVALRLQAPIYAQESLLTAVADDEDEDSDDAITGSASSAPPGGQSSDPDALSTEQLKEHLERLRPEDFGKFNL